MNKKETEKEAVSKVSDSWFTLNDLLTLILATIVIFLPIVLFYVIFYFYFFEI